MGKPVVFQSVGGAYPGRSAFNLSYEKKFTCDMGQLIPVMCDEVVPGDVMSIGNEIVIRMQPLVAPVLHEINCFVHSFFVPYRILWDEWEDFITGGPDGDSAAVLPLWTPTNNAKGSLWDFLGLPIAVDPVGIRPVDFIRRAYNKIYNEYYRDQNLITEVAETNEDILIRAWEKDRFTSALLEQQRGTAPALPVTITGSAEWPSSDFVSGTPGTPLNVQVNNAVGSDVHLYANGATAKGNLDLLFNHNTIDADAVTFDVNDLRLAFQIQKWLERNNRAGARYTEFLKAHFGVNPRDDRLQRPEYIGGSRSPVIISEVLQTSETDTTPQGTLAGHGITVDKKFLGKYHVKEFGLIMNIMSIIPRPSYQQGVPKQWIKRTKYDWYFPEFAHLGEQAIERGELYASAVEAENETIFGYCGRYDELRVKDNMVCSEMRDTFDYWHLGRQFSAAPELNQDFVECVPDKRIFAVPAEAGFIVNYGNVVKGVRPIPAIGEPGLIDHG